MSSVVFPSVRSGENGHRTDADIFPPLKRMGTRRNLFGPVDHAELQRELKAKLHEISERDQRRWNFDFSEDKPLAGELKWEESYALDCPEFYRETTPVSKKSFTDLLTAKTTIQIPPKQVVGDSARISKQLRRTKIISRGKVSLKRVQSNSHANMRITDFYGKRKKTEIIRK